MSKRKNSTIPPTADRMGRFIGQLRSYEGIPLHRLAHGLCSAPFLNRIENGEREVGKQMTDTFFQRLGKPAELFERILDWDEFQQWTRRQEILSHLHHGRIHNAITELQEYLPVGAEILDQQFAKIVEINCRHLSGASPDELLPMVRDALLLTQPEFQATQVDELLLSQNEGRLLFVYLQLTEQLEGFDSVSESYRALLSYFKKPRYESRERVYLFPYVACQVIENNYRCGQYTSALEICDDALGELTKEKRLFACDHLLEWKQKLHDALGNPDRTPEKLLEQVRLIQNHASKRTELLIPCDERGHVYCINQVIADRRKLLGISQESLSEGICEPRTISRIETSGSGLQRKNRKLLLQKVNMSGERYDYEVITDHYEDYLLRSEIDRAVVVENLTLAQELLTRLRQSMPDIPNNVQYITKKDVQIRNAYPKSHSEYISLEELSKQLEATLSMTIPKNINTIGTWSACTLSVNEILTLILYAFCCKKLGMHEISLSVYSFLKRSMENTGASVSFYEDLYTRIQLNIASILGDIGQYQDSNRLAYECIPLSLENDNISLIPQYLYTIAWNMTQQLSECSMEEREQLNRESKNLLRQAYAAAILSGDSSMQQHCSSRYQKTFGEELTL